MIALGLTKNRILEYEQKFVLQGFVRVVCCELPFALQFCESPKFVMPVQTGIQRTTPHERPYIG
jgi:hypothetical protein